MLQSSPDYPTKPVRLIEPFGAGGGPDLVGRALAQKLTEQWGQPVTMENIPGAGATAGPARVAKSPADGCTLLVNTSAQAICPHPGARITQYTNIALIVSIREVALLGLPSDPSGIAFERKRLLCPVDVPGAMAQVW